jgi:Smr domain
MLGEIERSAAAQPWADQRPWTAATHVFWEGEVPVVDLHDLKATLARDAVRTVLTRPAEGGAVIFVHGHGRHTVGAGSVLRDVVAKELRRACAEVSHWSYRPLGPARWVWITDWERVPAKVSGGGGGSLAWVVGLAFGVLVSWAVGRELGCW